MVVKSRLKQIIVVFSPQMENLWETLIENLVVYNCNQKPA